MTANSETTRVISCLPTTQDQRFPYIAEALKSLPNGTVKDGELVALDSDGHPDFNRLQNFRSAESHIVYYAFDILVHKNRDLTQFPLSDF
jgi:bifunctional non-homologous end joining protein LigD